MTSFTLNLISVKVSFHDIFKKKLNITPVNITSVTVVIAFMVCLISVPKFRSIKDRLITPKSKPNIINGLQVKS